MKQQCKSVVRRLLFTAAKIIECHIASEYRGCVRVNFNFRLHRRPLAHESTLRYHNFPPAKLTKTRSSDSISNRLWPTAYASYRRDILVVRRKMDGENIAITVNHWPSRRGGEKATPPLRNAAAIINKRIVDENTAVGINTLVMGDLNEDPVDVSVKGVLRARTRPDNLSEKDIFNPMYTFYKRGTGTTAYRDTWSLFDQIIVSSNLIRA